ncbi:hypothetical protein E4G67_00275 [Candidatus Bathyarchaeota archaeon]|nr:MAG: hypothetical protein E4G67_00275 [Candidatus Bathyarchaeota archaeon]
MPVGKKIYDMMSEKFDGKKKRANTIAKKLGAVEPPTVDQFKKNKVTRAASKNVHTVNLVGPRHVSKNEGMPAVNGKSGPELVKKAVTKIRLKEKRLDPAAGAINQTGRASKCSLCGKPGHTKRSCPSK